ncbi:hypothetical protein MMC07_001458 [Pseudocyphellaria aurata]|nr:hypothetical protein [Pseudocyphellaria aurata]
MHKHTPLMLGTTEAGDILYFVPGKDMMYPEMQQLESNDKDHRDFVRDVVLGVWFTTEEMLDGKEDDESLFVMDDIIPQLEVFLQLGAILIAESVYQDFQYWKPSRYQLVVNLEDESLWVLRKPYVCTSDAVNKEFASEQTTEVKWDSSFESERGKKYRLVHGRLGSWNSLFGRNNRSWPRQLHPTHVHSKEYELDDPVLCTARRTEFGGIRRTNDFSFKGRKYRESKEPEDA